MSLVVLAMSGGVDSSVAAWLLRRQGHDVIGLFMRHGAVVSGQGSGVCASEPQTPAASHRQGCCSVADAGDARRVADQLELPFYALNFEDQFGQIIDYFVDEYTAGRTPNPCIMCNTWLKFGKLFAYADSVGAEFVATGHYARLVPQADGPPALMRAGDAGKDQSYVLFGVQRGLLPRMLLPVGDYSKEAIRRMAATAGLRVAQKPDSQEICFVPDNDYARFVRQRRAAAGPGEPVDTAGEIVTTDGTVVGRHAGLESFTVGQRKGLALAFGQPRYVVRIDALRRQVVIGTRAELARTTLTARDVNWLIDEPREPLRCQVKIRYRSRLVPATVTPLAEGRLAVALDEPCEGVAPGQAAVCYDGDRVLGGGWIE